MSNVPGELRYAKSHEWLKSGADREATVGITDYAQASLGDITYVQLPRVGAALKQAEHQRHSRRRLQLTVEEVGIARM